MKETNHYNSAPYSLARNKIILYTMGDVYFFALILVPLAAVVTYFKQLEIFYMVLLIGSILVLMLPYSLLKGIGILLKTPKSIALQQNFIEIDDEMIPLEEISMVKIPPATHQKLVKMVLAKKEGPTRTYFLGYTTKKGNLIFPEYEVFAKGLENALLKRPGCFQLDL